MCSGLFQLLSSMDLSKIEINKKGFWITSLGKELNKYFSSCNINPVLHEQSLSLPSLEAIQSIATSIPTQSFIGIGNRSPYSIREIDHVLFYYIKNTDFFLITSLRKKKKLWFLHSSNLPGFISDSFCDYSFFSVPSLASIEPVPEFKENNFHSLLSKDPEKGILYLWKFLTGNSFRYNPPEETLKFMEQIWENYKKIQSTSSMPSVDHEIILSKTLFEKEISKSKARCWKTTYAGFVEFLLLKFRNKSPGTIENAYLVKLWSMRNDLSTQPFIASVAESTMISTPIDIPSTLDSRIEFSSFVFTNFRLIETFSKASELFKPTKNNYKIMEVDYSVSLKHLPRTFFLVKEEDEELIFFPCIKLNRSIFIIKFPSSQQMEITEDSLDLKSLSTHFSGFKLARISWILRIDSVASNHSIGSTVMPPKNSGTKTISSTAPAQSSEKRNSKEKLLANSRSDPPESSNKTKKRINYRWTRILNKHNPLDQPRHWIKLLKKSARRSTSQNERNLARSQLFSPVFPGINHLAHFRGKDLKNYVQDFLKYTEEILYPKNDLPAKDINPVHFISCSFDIPESLVQFLNLLTKGSNPARDIIVSHSVTSLHKHLLLAEFQDLLSKFTFPLGFIKEITWNQGEIRPENLPFFGIAIMLDKDLLQKFLSNSPGLPLSCSSLQKNTNKLLEILNKNGPRSLLPTQNIFLENLQYFFLVVSSLSHYLPNDENLPSLFSFLEDLAPILEFKPNYSEPMEILFRFLPFDQDSLCIQKFLEGFSKLKKSIHKLASSKNLDSHLHKKFQEAQEYKKKWRIRSLFSSEKKFLDDKEKNRVFLFAKKEQGDKPVLENSGSAFVGIALKGKALDESPVYSIPFASLPMNSSKDIKKRKSHGDKSFRPGSQPFQKLQEELSEEIIFITITPASSCINSNTNSSSSSDNNNNQNKPQKKEEKKTTPKATPTNNKKKKNKKYKQRQTSTTRKGYEVNERDPSDKIFWIPPLVKNQLKEEFAFDFDKPRFVIYTNQELRSMVQLCTPSHLRAYSKGNNLSLIPTLKNLIWRNNEFSKFEDCSLENKILNPQLFPEKLQLSYYALDLILLHLENQNSKKRKISQVPSVGKTKKEEDNLPEELNPSQPDTRTFSDLTPNSKQVQVLKKSRLEKWNLILEDANILTSRLSSCPNQTLYKILGILTFEGKKVEKCNQMKIPDFLEFFKSSLLDSDRSEKSPWNKSLSKFGRLSFPSKESFQFRTFENPRVNQENEDLIRRITLKREVTNSGRLQMQGRRTFTRKTKLQSLLKLSNQESESNFISEIEDLSCQFTIAMSEFSIFFNYYLLFYQGIEKIRIKQEKLYSLLNLFLGCGNIGKTSFKSKHLCQEEEEFVLKYIETFPSKSELCKQDHISSMLNWFSASYFDSLLLHFLKNFSKRIEQYCSALLREKLQVSPTPVSSESKISSPSLGRNRQIPVTLFLSTFLDT